MDLESEQPQQRVHRSFKKEGLEVDIKEFYSSILSFMSTKPFFPQKNPKKKTHAIKKYLCSGHFYAQDMIQKWKKAVSGEDLWIAKFLNQRPLKIITVEMAGLIKGFLDEFMEEEGGLPHRPIIKKKDLKDLRRCLLHKNLDRNLIQRLKKHSNNSPEYFRRKHQNLSKASAVFSWAAEIPLRSEPEDLSFEIFGVFAQGLLNGKFAETDKIWQSSVRVDFALKKLEDLFFYKKASLDIFPDIFPLIQKRIEAGGALVEGLKKAYYPFTTQPDLLGTEDFARVSTNYLLACIANNIYMKEWAKLIPNRVRAQEAFDLAYLCKKAFLTEGALAP